MNNPMNKLIKPLKFRYEKMYTKQFGFITRPVAEVQFWSETFQEWQRYTLLVDSGADYTVLPRYMAGLLGLDLENVPRVETQGIAGQHQFYLLEEVKVKLGGFHRTIPVGIAATSKIPPLMGRHLFFETFTTTFVTTSHLEFQDSQGI